MVWTRPAVFHAEAVAGVVALGGSTGDHCNPCVMDRMSLTIDVAPLLDGRGRAICDTLCALLRLLLRVTWRDQKAI